MSYTESEASIRCHVCQRGMVFGYMNFVFGYLDFRFYGLVAYMEHNPI